MRDLPAGGRIAVLVTSGCVLFFAVANLGTRDSPYAPNEWLFSHEFLAQSAIDQERIPFNEEIITESSFSQTLPQFQQETGLNRSTFYTTTAWHFWNGLPLQPSLLASLSLLSGAAPDQAARTPIGAFVILALVFASADLLMHRTRKPWPALAPVLFPVASAPLVLDLRVLMPSTSLVAVGVVLHLLLRRHALGDRRALGLALVPIVLLPFWYYTVSYLVISLFLGLFLFHGLARLRRFQFEPLAPLWFCALVPIVLAATLVLNGALRSHVELSAQMTSAPLLGPDTGGDYSSHLNRQPWRSALLYAESALLLAPLAYVAVRALGSARANPRRDAGNGVFLQWSIGVGLFTAALVVSLGVSFLNRTMIYLAPAAIMAALYVLNRASRRLARWAASAAAAVLLAVTPLLVATAAPTYSTGDRGGLQWMDRHEHHERVVYSSLEMSSILFRQYAFHNAIAFRPSERLLRDFWYGTEANATIPYLDSFQVFVLRQDVQTSGFMDFGPLREPISSQAYNKFSLDPNLQLVFDNGHMQIFHVAIRSQASIQEP